MHARLCVIFIVLILFFAGAARAQTKLADPEPTPDSPRRVALALNTDDPKIVNGLLFNVINIQKFYGMDNVRLVVVAYNRGVRALMKDTSPVPERIRSQQLYGVKFLACGNTLVAMGKKADSLIEGVGVVKAGLPELVERQLRGWVILNPY